MKSKLRKSIAFTIILITFLCYTGGAWIEASFNISNWEYEVRQTIGIVWMVLNVLGSLGVSLEKSDKRTNLYN